MEHDNTRITMSEDGKVTFTADEIRIPNSASLPAWMERLNQQDVFIVSLQDQISHLESRLSYLDAKLNSLMGG